MSLIIKVADNSNRCVYATRLIVPPCSPDNLTPPPFFPLPILTPAAYLLQSGLLVMGGPRERSSLGGGLLKRGNLALQGDHLEVRLLHVSQLGNRRPTHFLRKKEMNPGVYGVSMGLAVIRLSFLPIPLSACVRRKAGTYLQGLFQAIDFCRLQRPQSDRSKGNI